MERRQTAKNLSRRCGAGGFKNYAREWWHFTLENEPFPRERFNFPVTAE
ncbi:M15 family metallopeptidase [Mesorhizobium sp. M1329]